MRRFGEKISKYRGFEVGISLEYLRISYKVRLVGLNWEVGKLVGRICNGGME